MVNVCRSTGAAGPGFPGYASPPQSQPDTATSSQPTSAHISTATEEVGEASTNATASDLSSRQAETIASSSTSQGRTGLFQSRDGAPRSSQRDENRSFAFSARSLSGETSVKEEICEDTQQQQSSQEATSLASASSSASFSIGEGDDVMSEIRQRRLQRFHSSPVSPLGRQDSAGSGTGSPTGKTSLTGPREAGADSENSETEK